MSIKTQFIIALAVAFTILGTACDLYPPSIFGETGGTGEEDAQWLDCWIHKNKVGDTLSAYTLCWEPSVVADAQLAVWDYEKIDQAICNDEWATYDWVIGGDWVSTSTKVHVCGQWPNESREAYNGEGFSILEFTKDGEMLAPRFLPDYWPTVDMATLGSSFQYCEKGVACTSLMSGCFCKCDSDSDCNGNLPEDMFCLDGEGSVDVPVCAYDGEVPDLTPIEI